MFIGGFVGRGMHGALALPWQRGVCWLLCSLAAVCSLNATIVLETALCGFIFVGAMFAGIVTPNLQAALVEHNMVRRGTVAGMFAVCSTIAGLLASIITKQIALVYGNGYALFFVNMAWLPAGFLFYLAAITERREI